MMFNPTCPNLELLEYKAKLALLDDPEFQKKWNKVSPITLDAYVFPQIWGSTCLGFDVMPNGAPAIGGCAMTKAYTTVFHEASISGIYIIFFGNRVAYKVEQATSEFIEDLRTHNLAPISKAMVRY